ncbi:P-type DNA transfer ATPase VirB11 [Ralstonia holmesii]|uniref:P-type DNA transfer ATPase VirB11 n=1 Tax=Ralstonia TaxID=48736 RepID=UPI00046A0A63|nr:P-type DNA transfer ATPase VirB11 [Ralstonia pickettii]MCM3583790.1 P-type DNA transfer ATPase VirB11 [Ralstonia pickettii]
MNQRASAEVLSGAEGDGLDAAQREQQEFEQEKLEALRDRLRLFAPFMKEKGVQEITVNEPGAVWLWKGGAWIRVEVPELTFDYLKTVGRNLSSFSKKPFNRHNTSLSGHMPITGERIEMTHPPTCPENTHYLNIRLHTATAFAHEQFVEWEYYKDTRHEFAFSVSDDQRERLKAALTNEERELWELAQARDWPTFMRKAVEYKQNIVVSGATGSGKTSYIRSLVEFVPHSERLITVEDTPEMPLPNHPNNNRLLYKKTEDGEGATAKDVLHSAMRKTPDRVFMAELRGDEAMFYLSGVLASGHPGGMTTTHANSPKDAFFRLAMLIKQSGPGGGIDLKDILMLLRQTVNVVVQLTFDHDKGRRYIPAIYFDPIYRLTLLD